MGDCANPRLQQEARHANCQQADRLSAMTTFNSQAIGLTIPDSFVLLADEVIE